MKRKRIATAALVVSLARLAKRRGVAANDEVGGSLDISHSPRGVALATFALVSLAIATTVVAGLLAL